MRGNTITFLRAASDTPTASPASEPLPCQVQPIGTFFPPGERPWTDATDTSVYDEPRRLCAGCSWRIGCLTLALDRREPHGVWGGTTPSERARIHIDAILPPILRPSTINLLDHPNLSPSNDSSIGA